MRLPFILLFVSVFVCCEHKGQTKLSDSGKKEVVLSRFVKNYPDFKPIVVKDIMQIRLQNDSILNLFYTKNNYLPVWMHDTLDTKSLYEFADILTKVDEHGLKPDMFAASNIRLLTDSIDSGAFAGNLDLLYKRVATLELLSTKTAIKYITGMSHGFVNPKALFKKDYDITIARPDSTFYADMYNGLRLDPIGTITGSHPVNETYLKLQDEYRLLKEKKEAGFKKIASGSATLKLGDKSKHVSNIAKRLMLTGEYKPDSVPADSLHVYKLDKTLLAAVNIFRKRNSYPEEQEVGKLTVDALNRPFDYYLEKIRVNMERYRWRRTKTIRNKHIEVNVAAAMLSAHDAKGDSLPLISRVCVGSIRNKTPLLQSDISYMNLNPVWNVPTSIAQKEIAVLQKKDPTYIKRHNMKLYKGGKEVDVESIDWKEVNPGKFSYSIRQSAGNGNSLGLVKFMFNNAFSVYLHDTPSKAAFNRKNRAVSHGCVRVQRPFDLAVFCASPVDELFEDQLFYSVNKPVVTEKGKQLLKEEKLKKLPNIINIDSKNKISLFIDYYTAFTYPKDSVIYYADDSYEYDNPILEGLGLKIATQKKEDL